MRAVIIASGSLSQPALDRAQLRSDDWLIAADGGARHCAALGIAPTTIIGDFDSLSESEVKRYHLDGVELIRHPSRKDATDLELALRLAADRGVQEVLILGALGQRWDQTLANLLLAAAPGLEHLTIRLIDGQQEIRPLRAGQSLEICGQPGDIVSLIPIGGDARGVTTEGLEYALVAGTLPFGSTLGVSNTLVTSRARLTLEQGLVLCLIIHRVVESS